MKVEQYKVVTAKVDDLSARVHSYLQNGWQPFGPPTFILKGDVRYTQWVEGYQTMVIYETQH